MVPTASWYRKDAAIRASAPGYRFASRRVWPTSTNAARHAMGARSCRGWWSRQKRNSGSANRRKSKAVGTKVDTRPACAEKGTIVRNTDKAASGNAPSSGNAPLKNGATSRSPTMVPTYPTAVPMPESRPRSSGGTRSGSIAL